MLNGRTLLTTINETVPVALSNLIAYLATYLFQAFMSRRLSPSEFGLLNSLLALLVLLSVPVSTLRLIIARATAETLNSSSYDAVYHLVVKALGSITPYVAGGSVLFAVASPFLARYFHTNSLELILMVGLATAVALYLPIADGALQGMQRFRSFAIAIILRNVGKLVLGGFFVGVGLGTSGAVSGVALSTVATAAYAFALILKGGRQAPRHEATSQLSRPLSLREGLLPVGLTYAALTVLVNADLVFARHYLLPTDAGLYSAAAVLGNLVYYIPAFIISVTIPKAARAHHAGETSAPYFWRGIAVTTALSGIVAMLFHILPGPVLSVTFGYEFTTTLTCQLLPVYTLAMLVLSVLSFECSYWLAGREYFFLGSLILGVGISVAGFLLWHQEATQLLASLVAGIAVAMVGANTCAIFRPKQRPKAGLL